jgi:hypothetical protein
MKIIRHIVNNNIMRHAVHNRVIHNLISNKIITSDGVFYKHVRYISNPKILRGDLVSAEFTFVSGEPFKFVSGDDFELVGG